MSRPENLYWDSCVFIRWLTRQPPDMVADIDQYIEDARKDRVQIHFSTALFAELRPRYFKGTRYGGITDLFRDLGSAFSPIDPSPNILIAAGELRDIDPVNPSDPNIEPSRKRSIGTADAIHLMTCVYLRDVRGLSDIVFHTFDEGRSPTWEGNCVPPIGFERWYPEHLRKGRIAEVCSLRRERPKHPQPDLVTGAQTNDGLISQQRH